MGILGRILGQRNDTVATTGQYIPADSSQTTALSRTGNAILESGNAMLDRAGRYYKENPRKVQLLGLLAAAAVLARVKQGRR
jgi:hypothetical protein